ncbi:MAG: endonuclease domain-containing protein [Nostoc sp. DedSLP03]|uniref:endonuclease domain-containing protein n=1 Tax=Nostoc sp. DedSLP03 TaxID=3075400 RepID=UPI002AD4FA9C|nr:endonuclease domain-containing protein [Nostoc sp. DedSLP03]MDZ7968553.1 endonuclease domain-containing protein [Nostoc sp. DedSLP03]
MTELYNKTSEKEKRRSLRNNMPSAEKIVWERLKNRQIDGCKFRRQYSIDVFVVDFYCPELKLAIEIDGDSHFQEGAQVYDYERQCFLESKGTYFLRFTNQQVYQELEGAIAMIAQTVCQLRKITPP